MRRFALIPPPQFQQRGFVSCKGIVEYRIDRTIAEKPGPEALKDYLSLVESKKHPNPKTRKEALAHCLERPKYEGTSDFQRWSNDLMAVYSDLPKYVHDMQYHMQKVWKVNSPSLTWSNNGNGAIEIVKLHPPT